MWNVADRKEIARAATDLRVWAIGVLGDATVIVAGEPKEDA
jgi:hypothetical protein